MKSTTTAGTTGRGFTAKRLLSLFAKPVLTEGVLFVALILLTSDYSAWKEAHEVSTWAVVQQVGLQMLYAYLITALVTMVGKRWFKWLVYALALTGFAVQVFLFDQFHTYLGPAMFRLIAETNPQETSEFISVQIISRKTLPTFTTVAIAAAAVLLAECLLRKPVRALFNLRWVRPVVLTVVAAGLACGIWATRVFADLMRCTNTEQATQWFDLNEVRPQDVVSLTLFSACELHLSSAETQHAIAVNQQVKNETAVCAQPDGDSINLVLVIGESFNKHHSSLYDYPHPTNVLLAHERDLGNLIVFGDVVSPYNKTSAVLKEVLTTSCLSSGLTWDQSPLFTTIFKQAGYRVWMWDNQKHTYPLATFTFTLNSFIYDPAVIADAYDHCNDSIYLYDGELLANLVAHGAPQAGCRNLIILHLMGQHVDPATRYPNDNPAFARFTADSVKRNDTWLDHDKRQHIAHYDNATVYNDWVMSQVFNLFRHDNAVVVYFSDHGEEVYDWRDFCMRTDDVQVSAQEARHQYEVPFMVWCSDRYRAAHPQQMQQLQQAASKPMMLDDVCQMLFDLAQLRTPHYRPQCDVLSPDYRPTRRMINHVVDYDSLMTTAGLKH